MTSPALQVLSEIAGHIKSHIDRTALFRGQAENFPLIPKVGRQRFQVTSSSGVPLDDLGRFKQWEKEAQRVLGVHQHSQWELYAMAQHHGLATRLLDWSSNPMVALFFACWGSPERDGVFIVWNPGYQELPFVDRSAPLEEQKRLGIFDPNPVNNRFIAQHGLFTYHPEPAKPLENKNITRIPVKAADKTSILLDLRKYGFSADRLFPDLDGLAQDMNFVTENARAIVESGLAPKNLRGKKGKKKPWGQQQMQQ